jgi:ABC-2 type transport system ATP-binding protein
VSAPANAIEVEGLHKRYGQLEAVSDVSFEVRTGEVFCLLGPNGAGKTTTVEILEGYRTRSAGNVRVLGMDPAHGERALRERVGIVLQSCGVQSELTVRELLEMYGRYYTRRRSREMAGARLPAPARRRAGLRRLRAPRGRPRRKPQPATVGYRA